MRCQTEPVRLLTAVPICDGHDSAITTINMELIRNGIEVIYLGYHRSARDIARAAVQEDVRAIGISSYNGGHVDFFREVKTHLHRCGANDIGLFGGGGGTISREDAKTMRRHGVDRIFFPGALLSEIVAFVKETYGTSQLVKISNHSNRTCDRELARALGAGPSRKKGTVKSRLISKLTSHDLKSGHLPVPLIVGITGPGGVGKTTLIDELVLRFRKSRPGGRVAILSHDPSLSGSGALLGDRAAMIHSQSDQVFMRSLATRGRAGGLAPTTEQCLGILRSLGNGNVAAFELILIETVGTGQEADPFSKGMVDRSVLVMSPDYGARLQLQKIVMLDQADIVVVNKSDLAGAVTASLEIEQRLAANGRGQKPITTTAKRHRDAGVDALFGMIMTRGNPKGALELRGQPGPS